VAVANRGLSQQPKSSTCIITILVGQGVRFARNATRITWARLQHVASVVRFFYCCIGILIDLVTIAETSDIELIRQQVAMAQRGG
jgi:hypothetical protein